MGNTPSTNTKTPNSTSSSPSNHEVSRTPSTRRDHPRNLIQPQRTTATAEPSLAQARGTTTAHRTRNSQSYPVAFAGQSSPSHSLHSPSHPKGDAPLGVPHAKDERIIARDIPSRPVDVPSASINIESSSVRSHSQSIDPSGPPATQDMSYHLTRPPRLPLPIEEEVHTPGSPIIAPADVEVPGLDGEPLDDEATLPRRTSAVSNTTIDEEDAEELRVHKDKALVPTTFEWSEGGEKVYVTGTIFQWNKKHRLHAVPSQPGLFRAVVYVRPGTHHVRFIVDGNLLCSGKMPTTVDFGNNLVNYIEVSADDIPRDQSAPTQTSQSQRDSVQLDESGQKPKAKHPPKTKPVLPNDRYSSVVPQYLLDLDKAEDSAAYQYAAAAIEKLPTPPSLPGFLGKPILNAATPMKDDNSVLTMPNHTVLNHLGTSSIKNMVLAVSATTRYKQKYVTTIMYKPTGDE